MGGGAAAVGAGGGAAAVPPGKQAKPNQVAAHVAPALQSVGAAQPPQRPFTHRAKGHWMSASVAQKKPAAAGPTGVAAGAAVAAAVG